MNPDCQLSTDGATRASAPIRFRLLNRLEASVKPTARSSQFDVHLLAKRAEPLGLLRLLLADFVAEVGDWRHDECLEAFWLPCGPEGTTAWTPTHATLTQRMP